VRRVLGGCERKPARETPNGRRSVIKCRRGRCATPAASLRFVLIRSAFNKPDVRPRSSTLRPGGAAFRPAVASAHGTASIARATRRSP
jgi:hypothetical protein